MESCKLYCVELLVMTPYPCKMIFVPVLARRLKVKDNTEMLESFCMLHVPVLTKAKESANVCLIYTLQ